MAIATDGHMVDPSVAASHVMPTTAQMPGETIRNALDAGQLVVPKGMKVADTYRMFGDADPNFDIWWGQHLNQIARDPGGQLIAQAYGAALSNGLSEEEATRRALQAAQSPSRTWITRRNARFLRATYTSIDGVDPETAFAKWRVDSLKGAVTGADGTVHTDLVAKIANGDNINYKDVAHVNPAEVPSQIPGREFLKDTSSRIDRLSEIAHKKVLGPVINMFARQPTFMAGVEDAYQAYKPLVEQGLVDRSYALDMSMQDAATKMIKFIHNPAERLQLTETMHNVAPFWFAQVQSYKRYGRLLLEDPGAFRRAQLVLTGMTDLANRAKDPSGVTQAVYPGSGWFTQGMLTAAATLGMPVTSAVPVVVRRVHVVDAGDRPVHRGHLRCPPEHGAVGVDRRPPDRQLRPSRHSGCHVDRRPDDRRRRLPGAGRRVLHAWADPEHPDPRRHRRCRVQRPRPAPLQRLDLDPDASRIWTTPRTSPWGNGTGRRSTRSMWPRAVTRTVLTR